jgi:uncharacterized protein
MPRGEAGRRRCAIYARKSSEEGLEQEFNSLAAQREACSGIGEGLARSIVTYREANGPFRTRGVLKKVPRLGPKAFELSAGFLRIREGDDPLDASGVHPEAYSVVRRILATTKSELKTLIGNTSALRQLEPEAFTNAVFGVPTVTDILQELEKPGRDPRPIFKTATFREGVEKLEDLKPGMVLEGVVTNVAAFGARLPSAPTACRCLSRN